MGGGWWVRGEWKVFGFEVRGTRWVAGDGWVGGWVESVRAGKCGGREALARWSSLGHTGSLPEDLPAHKLSCIQELFIQNLELFTWNQKRICLLPSLSHLVTLQEQDAKRGATLSAQYEAHLAGAAAAAAASSGGSQAATAAAAAYAANLEASRQRQREEAESRQQQRK